MVKPQNDVMIIVELGAGHRDWLVSVMGEDRKGTGSIKANTTNSRSIYVVLVRGSSNCSTYASPDVICRLLLRKVLALISRSRPCVPSP